jgi:hypothetical protein
VHKTVHQTMSDVEGCRDEEARDVESVDTELPSGQHDNGQYRR